MDKYYLLKVKVDDECVAVVNITEKRYRSLADVKEAVEIIYGEDATFCVECKAKGAGDSCGEEGKEDAA